MSPDPVAAATSPEKTAPRPISISPPLIFIAASLLVVLPVMLSGYPTGHDSFLHATAWFDTLTHWHEGNFFPAWSSRFALGWGQPVHIFYPPLSVNFGALCLLVFGPYFAPMAFAWAALSLAGYGAYRLARLLVPEKHAVVAGVAYLLSPYFVLNLYERNAFGEVMAAGIFPFVLYAYVRMQRRERSPLWTACGLCLMMLTNIPATAITVSVIAVLTIMDVLRQRSAPPLLRSAVAGVVAICLAAFYLVPVLAQKGFIKLNLVATGGQAPVNNFEIFAGHPLFQHEFFSYLAFISALLVCLLLICVATSYLGSPLAMRSSWVAVSALAILLMLPVTAKLYSLPGMKYINFPWRYLFVVSLMIAIFVANKLGHSKHASLMLVAVAIGYAACWFAMWPPTWLHNEEASWGKYSAARTAELPGVQELMPITARYDEEGRYGPTAAISVESGAPCRELQIVAWQSEHRIIRFDCPPSTILVMKTFFYPGWRILANKHPAPVAYNEHGAFVVQVNGAGTIDMRFTFTSDRKLGWAITLVTLLACLGYVSWIRRPAANLVAQ